MPLKQAARDIQVRLPAAGQDGGKQGGAAEQVNIAAGISVAHATESGIAVRPLLGPAGLPLPKPAALSVLPCPPPPPTHSLPHVKCSTMLAMRLAGSTARSLWSMDSSYSSTNWASEVYVERCQHAVER